MSLSYLLVHDRDYRVFFFCVIPVKSDKILQACEIKPLFQVTKSQEGKVYDYRRSDNLIISIVLLSDIRHEYRNERYEIYFDGNTDVTGMTKKPIFCAEMPDEESTGNAFWQIKFVCDCSSFDLDWQKIEAFLPRMTSEAKCGLRSMTNFLLARFTSDEKIDLGMRHIFFAPDDDGLSYRELKLTSCSDEENEPFAVLSVQVLYRDLKLVHEIANFWCMHDSSQPMIVIPSEQPSDGKIIPLLNRPSILCSWDGPRSGLGVFFLPNFRYFFINEVAKHGGTEIMLNFPTENEMFILAPTGAMYRLEKNSVINPKNRIYPFQSLPLPISPTAPIGLATFQIIFDVILCCLNTPSDPKHEQKKTDTSVSTALRMKV
ncbi:hypothetical protein Aperf_G00000099277 [Anoplocephala perfoliata]